MQWLLAALVVFGAARVLNGARGATLEHRAKILEVSECRHVFGRWNSYVFGLVSAASCCLLYWFTAGAFVVVDIVFELGGVADACCAADTLVRITEVGPLALLVSRLLHTSGRITTLLAAVGKFGLNLVCFVWACRDSLQGLFLN